MVCAKTGSAVGKISKNVIYKSHFGKGRKVYLNMWFLRNGLLEKVTKVIIKYSLLESSSFVNTFDVPLSR